MSRRGTHQEPGAAFWVAFQRSVREPSAELRRLQTVWPGVLASIERERAALVKSIPIDDPIRSPVDLLGPLRMQRDERAHSLALAYFIDPNRAHGFGKAPLAAILRRLKNGNADDNENVDDALRVLRDARAQVTVVPEYRVRVEGARARRLARADLWIEMRTRRRSALVVVENKVDAIESEAQLTWYEQAAERWRKRAGRGAVVLLLFLTRDGRAPASSPSGRWLCVSYPRLAGALRSAWLSHRKAPGAAWLGYYLGTIGSAIVDLRVAGPNVPDIGALGEYLERV